MLLRVFGMLSITSVLALGLAAAPASAEGKGKAAAKKKAEEPAPTGPAKMKGKLGLSPKGLGWNASLEAVAKIYDKVFDQEFMPLYKKAQPGPGMDALDAELADKKAAAPAEQDRVRRSAHRRRLQRTQGRVQLRQQGEHDEADAAHRRDSELLLLRRQAWKVYDEHKLRKGGPYGENWEEASEILTKKFGTAGFKVESDYAKGRNYAELQWTDGTTVIRAIDRGNVIGLVYQDANVFFNLPKYRPNKPKNPHAIDKDVAAATAKPPPPEEKKPDAQGQGQGQGQVAANLRGPPKAASRAQSASFWAPLGTMTPDETETCALGATARIAGSMIWRRARALPGQPPKRPLR